MEKTIKKSKKKSKRLKKRIGIIAVGGLSFVLTICLSVGATLAWFAGSSWASNDLYMGGPVYVEMAGRGQAGGTAGTGTDTAKWVGGAGNLDIKAAATRTTGTVDLAVAEGTGKYSTGTGAEGEKIPDNILLPGQKVQIYSQARVFSTAVTDSRADGNYPNVSSGANTDNTSNYAAGGKATYIDGTGRVTTTTTSVLRARFSIGIEFDPSVGFNNFTDNDYMTNYPVQTGTDWAAAASASLVWNTSPGADNSGKRRDAVDPSTTWSTKTDGTEDSALRAGTMKSIYKWRYVSATEYATAKATLAEVTGDGLLQMKSGGVLGGGVDGTHTTKAYACYIVKGGALQESDAFYKARTNAYLQSYIEFYENEYGNRVTRTIAQSIASLDTALNNSFKTLINDSSDDIQNGKVFGFTISNTGVKTAIDSTGAAGGSSLAPQGASWLYIDPSIGNDTNTNEISTSTGGWWYLVSSTGTFAGGDAKVNIVTDSVADPTGNTDGVNTPTAGTATARTDDAGDFGPSDGARLTAKLFEIDPTLQLNEVVGKNGGNDVKKVVSVAFPFVNGTFALPGDALTNVFANAKISFQISFQAIQAFFPYTTSIDKIDYKNPLYGTAKALNIKNAIPIFNEAFDYQETFSDDSASIPL